ncbi:heme-binding protein [Dactylosporangium sp. NPDC051541]|uniref:heme-binding protein n=1 Tax=Dactylosporangium sp. NPDC051541 TaxID=3363977 RepID=UPI0037A94B6D
MLEAVSSSRPRRRRLALAAGAAGAAAVIGVTGLTVSANAAPGTPAAVASKNVTVDNRSLSIDAAVKAAQAALKAAEQGGHRVTVVVLDRAGTVQVELKGDGAGPQTAESAHRKAFTAVSFGQPTSVLAGRVTGGGATLRDIPGTLFLAGGVPITVDGQPIAAIGVGGAPSGDLDEQYATAGAATLR